MDREDACGSGCKCDTQGCGCGSESCGCESSCCGDFYDVMEAKLMQMAFFAQKSALFERIRERIEKQDGDKLDRIAELVVEASRGEVKDKQDAERKRAELREKLRQVLGE